MSVAFEQVTLDNSIPFATVICSGQVHDLRDSNQMEAHTFCLISGKDKLFIHDWEQENKSFQELLREASLYQSYKL